jgi:hypothetical protein
VKNRILHFIAFLSAGLLLSIVNWRIGAIRCNEGCEAGSPTLIIIYSIIIPIVFAAVAVATTKIISSKKSALAVISGMLAVGVLISWVIIP